MASPAGMTAPGSRKSVYPARIRVGKAVDGSDGRFVTDGGLVGGSVCRVVGGLVVGPSVGGADGLVGLWPKAGGAVGDPEGAAVDGLADGLADGGADGETVGARMQP